MGDDPIVHEIPQAECLELLRTTAVGRVGGTVDGHPFVLPVNYAVDGDHVVFKTAAGTKLSGSTFARVAFEIDGFDARDRTGWSVVVEGVATDISDMVDSGSARLRQLDLQPWFPGEKSHWVAIQPESITGRRVSRTSPGA
ncbi:MAG TPA: pyridoxamine 5'-phosphate oxidase family protein [Acidimicrobiales bacterium]|nr:pyridoxamine 5'-phosphate oxidase family protein [Acidimicrobiales bacterium]